MGKFTISIVSHHWLQLKRFLLHRLQHLTGFMMILKKFMLVCFYRKLLKKWRQHGECDATIVLVTDNALNIEYYFWWRDYCFGLLIRHDAPLHFMVSISDEYKYKRLVKTNFKSCGKPIFLEIYHTRN